MHQTELCIIWHLGSSLGKITSYEVSMVTRYIFLSLVERGISVATAMFDLITNQVLLRESLKRIEQIDLFIEAFGRSG